MLSISVLIVREKKRGRDYARLLEYTRNISTGQLSEYMDYSEKEPSASESGDSSTEEYVRPAPEKHRRD